MEDLCFHSKLLIVGPPGAGKTAFVHRYLNHEPALGVNHSFVAESFSKLASIDGSMTQLSITDQPSRRMSHGESIKLMNRSTAFIVVYSVDCQESYDEAVDWLKRLRGE